MGAIVFRCGCGQRLSAKASLAGEVSRCPECGGVIRVPTVAKAEATAILRRRLLFGVYAVGVSICLAAMFAAAVMYRGRVERQPLQSAAARVAEAERLLAGGQYDRSLRELRQAERILDDAKVFQGPLRDRMRALETEPPLKYVLDGLVEYKGQWVTPTDKKMLERGYVNYGDQWVTPDEKAMLEAGYVRYGDTWVKPEEKSMLQAGLVQYEGRWVTPDEKTQLEHGLVNFEGRWVTAQERATVRCVRLITQFNKKADSAPSYTPEGILAAYDARVEFNRSLDLKDLDPRLAAFLRRWTDMTLEERDTTRELRTAMQQASARAETADAGAGLAERVPPDEQADEAGDGPAGTAPGAAAASDLIQQERQQLEQEWDAQLTWLEERARSFRQELSALLSELGRTYYLGAPEE